MDNRARDINRVPKRRGSSEHDEHWLENLDLERGEPVDEEDGTVEGEDLGEDFDDDFEDDEDEEEAEE